MGRSLLLTVITITVIFAGIAITLLERSQTLPDKLNRNLDTIALKNTSAFALNYAIKQLNTDADLQDDITILPEYHTISYSDFSIKDGCIDTLKYAYFNSDKDSLQILAVVSRDVDGEQIYRTGEARIGTSSSEDHPDKVGGWHFDETSGANALETTNNYNGTLDNFSNPNDAWESGKWGNSINLDGYNDLVSLPDDVVDSWHNKFTAATWVKLDNSFVDWGTIMSEQKNNSNKTVVWAVTSRLVDITFFGWTLYSELRFEFTINTKGYPNVSSVSIRRTGNQIDIYDWHFIVATYDGTYSRNRAKMTLSIIDENLTVSRIIKKIQFHPESGNIPNNVISVGGVETNSPWSGLFDAFRCIDGNIDEVNFFNNVLSADDINSLYLHNGFDNEAIIYWRQ